MRSDMAKAEQIKALIRCHAEGNNTRFYAIAMQVAAQAARSGHRNFAQELRDLIDKVRSQQPVYTPRVTRPKEELIGLFNMTYPSTRFADMALTTSLKTRLNRILKEQRQRSRLKLHGFSPQRKILFIGPPGTGKTMAASALAGELGLSLFAIRLDGLITKYMGETAAKLRLIFEAMNLTRGVYLFDEFDALGSQRTSTNDIGEIRRVLNSFLQFLEQDRSDSLVVGATNHVGLLDHALFRRFDVIVEHTLPSSEIAIKIMQNRLTLLESSRVDWSQVAKIASNGLSHAEITHACEQAAKNVLLDDSVLLETTNLIAALNERRAML